MEYIFKGLRRSVHESEPLRTTLARELDLADIDRVTVERESIDARRKPDVAYVYNLRFTVSRPGARLQQLLTSQVIAPYEPEPLPQVQPRITLPPRPVIVGFGPAGMFAGLWLARLGYRPIIFERGRPVEERARDVARLWNEAAKMLPAADYKPTCQHGGVGVYSFCVCPGGLVVCASSEPEGLVTNGMSRYARDMTWTNGAIVAAVDPAALGCRGPLEAIACQRALERRASELGGGGYIAPAQRAEDFYAGRVSARLPAVTYRPGVAAAPLHELLPDHIVEPLRAALRRFDRLMPCFLAQGVLIAPETRTSSPLRILRDANYRSLSTEGLYLLGEGAGYAGGIMTCARDAVKFASLVKPVQVHHRKRGHDK